MPANELLRYDAVGILGPHELIEGITVHVVRVRASTPLQVMDNTSGGSKPLHAQWARNVRATVGTGLEMLKLVSHWSQESCRGPAY